MAHGHSKPLQACVVQPYGCPLPTPASGVLLALTLVFLTPFFTHMSKNVQGAIIITGARRGGRQACCVKHAVLRMLRCHSCSSPVQQAHWQHNLVSQVSLACLTGEREPSCTG